MDKKGFILSSRLEQRATSQAVSYAVVKKKRKTSIELIVDLEGEANKQRKIGYISVYWYRRKLRFTRPSQGLNEYKNSLIELAQNVMTIKAF